MLARNAAHNTEEGRWVSVYAGAHSLLFVECSVADLEEDQPAALVGLDHDGNEIIVDIAQLTAIRVIPPSD